MIPRKEKQLAPDGRNMIPRKEKQLAPDGRNMIPRKATSSGWQEHDT